MGVGGGVINAGGLAQLRVLFGPEVNKEKKPEVELQLFQGQTDFISLDQVWFEDRKLMLILAK